MERRHFVTKEVRMSPSGNRLQGTAARYGVRANLKQFQEQIAARAFDRILASNPDVCCLFNHNADLVLGRTTAGTLQLRADDLGLHYTCDLPDTSAGRDLRESIKRGDVNGCSFAFLLEEGVDTDWSEEQDENRSRVLVRTIRNFSSLLDVSPVTYPAYSGTSVSARATQTAGEIRSRAERIARVHAIANKRRFPELEPGVCFEDAIESRDLTLRRKRLLKF